MKTSQQEILHHRELHYTLYPRSRKKPREGERDVPLLDMVRTNGGKEGPQCWWRRRGRLVGGFRRLGATGEHLQAGAAAGKELGSGLCEEL